MAPAPSTSISPAASISPCASSSAASAASILARMRACDGRRSKAMQGEGRSAAAKAIEGDRRRWKVSGGQGDRRRSKAIEGQRQPVEGDGRRWKADLGADACLRCRLGRRRLGLLRRQLSPPRLLRRRRLTRHRGLGSRDDLLRLDQIQTAPGANLRPWESMGDHRRSQEITGDHRRSSPLLA